MGADTAPVVVSPNALYDNDDLTLLQRVSAQDEQAFASLYGRYAQALRRSLSRAVGHASLVDEVLDDVMLVLWQDAGQFPTTVPGRNPAKAGVGTTTAGMLRPTSWMRSCCSSRTGTSVRTKVYGGSGKP